MSRMFRDLPRLRKASIRNLNSYEVRETAASVVPPTGGSQYPTQTSIHYPPYLSSRGLPRPRWLAVLVLVRSE
eukprot:scaffold671226_cov57-Prasinocladus_malaysianus.AAC.1